MTASSGGAVVVDHRYCRNEHDALVLASKTIKPLVEIELDEHSAQLVVLVTLPYTAGDRAWDVGIGATPECHARGLAEKATGGASAPNARFPGALSDATRYPASAFPAHDNWSVEPLGCGRIRARGQFALSDLSKKCACGATGLASGDVATVASFVSMRLLSKDDSASVWHAEWSLYADRHDSAVLLYQSAARGKRNNVALLRSVAVGPRGYLSLLLQLQATDDKQSLHEWHTTQATDPSFQLEMTQPPKPAFRLRAGEFARDWLLSSVARSELFDGDFVLHFDGERPDLHILVRIAAPRLSDAKLLDELHSRLGVHLSDAPAAHTGSLPSGADVCVQTELLAPESLRRKLRVSVASAWLCVDEKQCQRRRVLVDDGGVARQNVSVQQPGRFGLASAGVCFKASALFLPDGGASSPSLQREQIFQCRLQVSAAQYRSVLHGSVFNSTLFADISSAQPQESTGIASRIREHWLPSGAFATYELASVLAAHSIGDSVHTHKLKISASVEHLHNLNEGQMTLGLAFAFFTIICFFAAIFCVSTRTKIKK